MFISRVHILARAFESNFGSNVCIDLRIAETFIRGLTRRACDNWNISNNPAFALQLNLVSS